MQSSFDKKAQIELQQLSARVATLESLLAGAGGTLVDHAPVASDYRGQGAPAFAMLDAVGPYRKNGLFEIYGGNFRERRSGPISVTEADFEITHGQAWLIWSPDFTPGKDATHLQIKFAAPPTTGKLTVGFVLDDGQSLAWVLDLAAKSAEPAGLLPPILPEDIVTRANNAQVVGGIKLAGNQVTVPLPPSLVLNLRSGRTKAISQWFVKVDDAAGTTMRFQTLALVRPAPPATSTGVALAGKVVGGDIAPNTSIELLEESGATKKKCARDGW
ncbi:hypothetical protein AC628_02705 [Bradyrhizobium sp. NAS96.2]|nr:hypothetical protein AC628_02705 [Bradyrhizobium sp. NAS96.2]